MDTVNVPKGWKLAAADWGDQKSRRRDARGGAVCGVLIWNWETGEGEVLLHPVFLRGCGITVADALKDWGGLIEREYDNGFPLTAPKRNAR